MVPSHESEALEDKQKLQMKEQQQQQKKSKNNSNKSVGNKAQAFLAIKFVLMHICK